MRESISQESFSAGEISPLLWGRHSTATYGLGCKRLENFVPNAHGPLISREGSKYINSYDGDKGRIFGFQVDVNHYYMVVINDTNLTVNDPSGVKADEVFTGAWTEAQLEDIHVIRDPDGKSMYLLHPNVAPQKVTYAPTTDDFGFAVAPFTHKPTEWTGTNWPATGTMFQGRLYLAATPAEPQTIWGSVVNNHNDFQSTGGVASADDAITINITAFGRIKWLVGTKVLLVGTAVAELAIEADKGLLTALDHFVTNQSTYGSSGIQAEQVGDEVLFVSPDRKKLRAIQYNQDTNNWMSNDVTFMSEHITKQRIKRIEWQQNPNNKLWCLLDDGSLATLSYDRPANIVGWARNDFGHPVFDIGIGSLDGTDIMDMLVTRKAGKLYHESETLEHDHSIDSWIDFDLGSPGVDITGLDHLDGMQVQILADGAVMPEQTVTGGVLTLPYPVTHVTVGLQFIPLVIMLPLEKAVQGRPSAPYWKNFYNVNVHLLDSAHPLVNGIRQPTRHPSTQMNQREANTTGKSYIALTEWNNETDVIIQQDLPLPITVLAISGEIQQEKL